MPLQLSQQLNAAAAPDYRVKAVQESGSLEPLFLLLLSSATAAK